MTHDRKRQGYHSKVFKKTFTVCQGTMFERLRKLMDLIVIMVTLLTYGCLIQALKHVFGLDERTVTALRDRAGEHHQKIHRAVVEQGQLDLVPVQTDEIRMKGHKMIA